MAAPKPTACEIADRITAHLKRLEADKDWNRMVWESRTHGRQEASKLYNAHAHAGKSPTAKYVTITYVSYQGHRRFTRDEALVYLEWLDAGNRGKIFEQQREAESK